MLFVPRAECLSVTAFVLALAAERQHRQGAGPAVHKLAPQVGCDPDQLALLELDLLALDQERERAREHEIDLLLPEVTMDAAPLPRPQHDLVQAERADAERAAKTHEPVGGIGVDAGSGGAGLQGRGSYGVTMYA